VGQLSRTLFYLGSGIEDLRFRDLLTLHDVVKSIANVLSSHKDQPYVSIRAIEVRALTLITSRIIIDLYDQIFTHNQNKIDIDVLNNLQAMRNEILNITANIARQSESDEMLKTARELSRLTGPLRTTNRELAEEWESLGFAPPGTTYISPSSVVPSVNHEELAAQLNIQQPNEQELLTKARELSELTRAGTIYLSGRSLEEILADPKKRRKAKKMGLLPS